MKDVKRIVSTGFWNDLKVTDQFSPEDRYFMLYLLTNSHTTQLGIYELPLSRAANELGYTKDVVNVLLDRFETKYGIIKRSSETGEIAIKNYLRYSIVKGGKPVYDCLMKEEQNVKDKELLCYVICNLESYEQETLNSTVLEFIADIKEKYPKEINTNTKDKYINTNDNENERIVPRIVHESYHESSTNRQEHKNDTVFYPDNEKLNNAFLDYMEMRKRIRHPMTGRAVELAMGKLAKLSNGNDDTAIEILDEATFGSWQGLYPPKDQPKQKELSGLDYLASQIRGDT